MEVRQGGRPSGWGAWSVDGWMLGMSARYQAGIAVRMLIGPFGGERGKTAEEAMLAATAAAPGVRRAVWRKPL